MDKRLLIIGKKPLPIGGVTIHVSRTLDVLDKLELPYSFYNLSEFTLVGLVKRIIKYNNVHLHTSSPLFRLLVTLLCCCFRTVSIVTIHGNLGRFSKFYNFIDALSIELADYPIVLNKYSYSIALKINKSTKLMSAYVPSIKEEKLDDTTQNRLLKFRKEYQFVCCSNAYNYSIDKAGQEIYGIVELIDYFKEYQAYGFVLSDPSGKYEEILMNLPRNILIINRPHPFVDVLKKIDCYIRNTSTDGDSLSIHEALDNGVSVIATNVVDRPEGTILVERGNRKELDNAIEHVLKTKVRGKNIKSSLDSIDIIAFYKKHIYL